MRKKRSEEIEYKEEEADKKKERDNIFFSKPHGFCSVTVAPSFFLVLVFPFAFRTQATCCVLADFKEKKRKGIG